MKLRNILLVAASLCITWGGAYAQKKKTFYVPKAGTLVELLTENEAKCHHKHVHRKERHLP